MKRCGGCSVRLPVLRRRAEPGAPPANQPSGTQTGTRIAARRRSLKRPALWLAIIFGPVLLASMIAIAAPAFAQDISISLGEDLGVTERAVQIILLITILSLAPSILVMVTSFTRIVVVL